ncbi:tetratricopeptide repeat protein [Nostoc sp. WHI]|uniref:tetratricopeptide repeat protein n=1 Tax=Nostoc sp. WHI TaxID=2650611 RepID=UPI0018C7A2FA|nr:tetratricopeptide repeat protein [Nostoc sp. WHI]MBG1267856.1 tetratricopeptide repeat protein [Nostoc sp. WHI]
MFGAGNVNVNRLYNKGYDATCAGNHTEAVYWYDQCLKLAPNDHEAWMNRGLSLALLKEFDKAIESFNISIKIVPNNYEVWKFKGECLAIDLNLHEEAIECYKKALNLNPNDDRTWSNQGNSFSVLGRISEAKASWEKSLQVNPANYAAQKALSQLKNAGL